jgi:hypothetical protein
MMRRDQLPTATSPTQQRRLVAGYTALTALLVVVLLTGVLLHGGLHILLGNTSARGTSSPPTATSVRLRLTLTTHLTSLVIRSPTEGWAVGLEGAEAGVPPYLLHLLHGVWRAEPMPQIGIAPQAIAMVSATEGWIAGDDQHGYDGHGVMLHGTGGHWTPVSLPPGVGPIQSLAMISPSEGWAVSSASASGHAQILHYSQGSWTAAMPVPDGSFLFSLSMVSPTEGWAAGTDASTDAIWHYTQGTWQREALNDPEHANLEYVSMLSPDEGWGIGGYPLPHQPTDQYARQGGAIWHYTGGQWQVVERYADDPLQAIHLSAIQAFAPSDVWVAEGDGTGKRFLHGVDGVWQKVAAPIRDDIHSIALISPSEGWAVGDAGQILHYVDGNWTDYPTQ